jgi:prepilin-type N-terminal cleavage/methylation domain-containing protein
MTHRSAFTLIELLVVIAVIAILSIVVLLTLNPVQLLMQSRDGDRLSDMSTLNSALGDYLAEGGTSLGSTNVVYVSIPDPTATSSLGDQCQGLGLPSLPATYSYFCAPSSTYRNVNGTGWIPVNFNALAAGSPFGSLPIDPVNQSSSRLYYTYDTNGTNYEVTSVMESSKYQLGGSSDVIGTDGGTLSSVYEKGSQLGLEPLDYGDSTLVGWWNFSEGTGTVAYDYSGNNATGSWSGNATGTNGHYSPGKIGPWAGAFDGSTDQINVGNPASLNGFTSFTISEWINANNSLATVASINRRSGSNGLGLNFGSWGACSTGKVNITEGGNTGLCGNTTLSLNTWYYIAAVMNGSNVTIYVNGQPDASGTDSWTWTTGNNIFIGDEAGVTHVFPGLIDDVRIYNRALTATQIQAMYAGGK